MKKAILPTMIVCLGTLVWGHDHIYIAQHNMPAVVQINAIDTRGSTMSGTGFVIDPTGLIVTNRHVLNNVLYANITFNNGVTSGEATILAQDPTLDIALIKIEAQHLPFVTLAQDDNVLIGQTVTVIGNPRRLQNTVTSGIISQIRKQKNGVVWHQISAPISPSSSGSPVFNEKGEVISVAFASISGEGNQNLNFAIPIRYVQDLAQNNNIALPKDEFASQHPFLNHIRKSWQITKRLLHRWFGRE
jgi:S1-C subfamily serine protease